MNQVDCTDCGPVRPLLLERGVLYASYGYDLMYSVDEGRSFSRLASYNVSRLKKYVAYSRHAVRLFREGFHSMARADNGTIVAVVRGAIVLLEAGLHEFKCVQTITRGSRPLNICWVPRKGFYFGEYFSNPRRDSVRIYGSPDGWNWSVVYTFSRGSIRHVHGLYYDYYRDGVWVLTGDSDDESGLWFTGDGFNTLDVVLKGSQNARAVVVVPTESGLIVPMDSPITRNYIQRLDLNTGSFTRLAELPGSAFYASRVNELMLISTVVEPSDINTDSRVALFAGTEEGGWRCIGRYPRTSFGLLDRYLCYPSLILAPGDASSRCVFAYAMGVKDYDGRCLRWSLNDIQSSIG